MRYYLIAGEPSGDLYGAQLMKHIKSIDSSAEFHFWGGSLMQKESEGLVTDIEKTSVMGYTDVIKNLHKLNKYLRDTKKDILDWNPNVIIYIDYPGLNLRLAKWAKKEGFYNVYFICPKIWAWKKYRHKALRKNVDQLISILPFEKQFLSELDIQSQYFGHPLAGVLKMKKWSSKNQDKNTIAILPGSRKSELKFILPTVNQLIKHNIKYKYVVSTVEHIPLEFYTRYLDHNSHNLSFSKDTHSLLEKSSYAIVTSGTATLEAALIGIPQIVIYKADWFSYLIAKSLVKLDYISLPNLIADKMVVKELIQSKMTVQNILDELKLLENRLYVEEMIEHYNRLRQNLYRENAFEMIAQFIIERITP